MSGQSRSKYEVSGPTNKMDANTTGQHEGFSDKKNYPACCVECRKESWTCMQDEQGGCKCYPKK